MSLKTKVENLVRAEYQFRLGPHAYTDETTRWYLDAQDELRQELTGTKGIKGAAKRLGVATRVDYSIKQKKKRREKF